MKYIQYYQSKFTSLHDLSFDPIQYSKLKFGCNDSAKEFGQSLARDFFNHHIDKLLIDDLVVISSPYNNIKNAATILSEHFIKQLNSLLVHYNGKHVDTSVIHRKMTYTNDYGFLDKEKRKSLIKNDTFYLNNNFLKDKTIIFIDDINITGSHEERLIEILQENNLKNDCFFVYIAKYFGDSPEIESNLNFYGVNNLETFVELVNNNSNHVIIRTVKYILNLSKYDLRRILNNVSHDKLYEIYHVCLAEGYYTIDKYQPNFLEIQDKVFFNIKKV